MMENNDNDNGKGDQGRRTQKWAPPMQKEDVTEDAPVGLRVTRQVNNCHEPNKLLSMYLGIEHSQQNARGGVARMHLPVLSGEAAADEGQSMDDEEDEGMIMIDEQQQWNLGSSLSQQNLHLFGAAMGTSSSNSSRPQTIDLRQLEAGSNIIAVGSGSPHILVEGGGDSSSRPNNDQNDRGHSAAAQNAQMRHSYSTIMAQAPPQSTPNMFPSKESRHHQVIQSQSKATLDNLIRQNQSNMGMHRGSAVGVAGQSFNYHRGSHASNASVNPPQIQNTSAAPLPQGYKVPDFQKNYKGYPNQSQLQSESKPVLNHRRQQPKLIKTFMGASSSTVALNKSAHKGLQSPINRISDQHQKVGAGLNKSILNSSSVKKYDLTTPLQQQFLHSKIASGASIQPQNLSFSSGTKQSQVALNNVIQKYQNPQQFLTKSKPQQQVSQPLVLSKTSPNHSSMVQLTSQNQPQIMNNLSSFVSEQPSQKRQRSGGKTPKSTTSKEGGSYAAIASEKRNQEKAGNLSIGFLSQAVKKYNAPVGKIDLAQQQETDWNDSLKMFEQWNIQFETKNAYTKSEVVDLVKQIEGKLVQELIKQNHFERTKSVEFQEEAKLLEKQLKAYQDKECVIAQRMVEVKEVYAQHEEILKKMEECQMELKQTMLNSLMCLDFYRDLEGYIGDHRYNTSSKEVLTHLSAIDTLINQHGLNSLDFDTERIQLLIESIQDYVRANNIEKRVQEINLSSSSPKGGDYDFEGMTHAGMKIKVTKLVKSKPFNINSTPAIVSGGGYSTQACDHSQGNSACNQEGGGCNNNNRSSSYTNRHVGGMCLHHHSSNSNISSFQVPIKQSSHNEEIKVKNAIIARLREQLEHKMKKILELKNLLRQEKDAQHQHTKSNQYKEALIKLEREMNVVAIKNAQLSLEAKQMRKESDEVNLQMVKVKNLCRELQKENEEMRKVLKDTDGFNQLQETVVQLSGIMVSKTSDQLTAAQKEQLKAIFGNSSIIQKLRIHIMSLNENIQKAVLFLGSSLKLNIQLEDILEHLWQNTVKAIVPLALENQMDSVKNNLIKEWKSLEALRTFESRDILSRSHFLKELRKQVAGSHLMEYLNNQKLDHDKFELDLNIILLNNRHIPSFVDQHSMSGSGGGFETLQTSMGAAAFSKEPGSCRVGGFSRPAENLLEKYTEQGNHTVTKKAEAKFALIDSNFMIAPQQTLEKGDSDSLILANDAARVIVNHHRYIQSEQNKLLEDKNPPQFGIQNNNAFNILQGFDLLRDEVNYLDGGEDDESLNQLLNYQQRGDDQLAEDRMVITDINFMAENNAKLVSQLGEQLQMVDTSERGRRNFQLEYQGRGGGPQTTTLTRNMERSNQSFSQPPPMIFERRYQGANGIMITGEDALSKISKDNVESGIITADRIYASGILAQEDLSEINSVARFTATEGNGGGSSTYRAGDATTKNNYFPGLSGQPKISKKMLREKLKKLKLRNTDLSATVKELLAKVAKLEEAKGHNLINESVDSRQNDEQQLAYNPRVFKEVELPKIILTKADSLQSAAESITDRSQGLLSDKNAKNRGASKPNDLAWVAEQDRISQTIVKR